MNISQISFFIFLVILVLILLYRFTKPTNLYSLEYETYTWVEIDSDLQNEFLLRSEFKIFDLDNDKALDVHDSSIVGIWAGKKTFTINGHKYCLDWNGNREQFSILKRGSSLYMMYNGPGGGSSFRTHKTFSKYKCYKFKLLDN